MDVTGDTAAPPPFRPVGRAEWWLLAAVVAMAAVHAATTVLRTPDSYLFWADYGLYTAVYAGAGVLRVLRARRQPAQRWAWAALAASLLLNALGETYHAAFLLHDPSPAYPSPADWLWLSFFPAAYTGLVLFLRTTISRFAITMWLDALIVALSLVSFCYALAFGYLLSVSGGSVAAVVTNLAYPLGDLLLLMLVVAAAAFGDVMQRMWALLALGFLAFAAADTWYAMQESAGTYRDGTPMDTLWTLGALLVSVAAVTRPPVVTAPQERPWWHVTILPVVFAAGSLGLLTYGQAAPVPEVSVALALAALLVGIVRANVNYWEATRLAESREQARTDELTGLANRRGFVAGLETVLRERAGDEPVAVLLIDLDRFKEINDALGHEVGDRLLTQLGPRMARCLRPEDLLARLGGDEFAIVLRQRADADTATAVAERIGDALTTPFDLGDGGRLDAAAAGRRGDVRREAPRRRLPPVRPRPRLAEPRPAGDDREPAHGDRPGGADAALSAQAGCPHRPRGACSRWRSPRARSWPTPPAPGRWCRS